MKTPTMPDLCRAAADAVTRLCATLRDCTREVEERKGKIEARRRLARERSAAADAIEAIYYEGPGQATQELMTEIFDIARGCRDGYVREAWALRLLQMAAVAPEPRDTEPSPAPTEGCGCQCFNCRAALHHLCDRPHGCGPTPPCACGAATGESHRAGCVCLGEMATTCGGGSDG